MTKLLPSPHFFVTVQETVSWISFEKSRASCLFPIYILRFADVLCDCSLLFGRWNSQWCCSFCPYSQLQAKELYIVKCIPLANLRYSWNCHHILDQVIQRVSPLNLHCNLHFWIKGQQIKSNKTVYLFLKDFIPQTQFWWHYSLIYLVRQ